MEITKDKLIPRVLVLGMLLLAAAASAGPLQSFWPILALTVCALFSAARETFTLPRTGSVILLRLFSALGILFMGATLLFSSRLPVITGVLEGIIMGIVALEMLSLPLLGLKERALKGVTILTTIHMLLLCVVSHPSILLPLSAFFLLQLFFWLTIHSRSFPEAAIRQGRFRRAIRRIPFWSDRIEGEALQDTGAASRSLFLLGILSGGFAAMLFVISPRTPFSFDLFRTRENKMSRIEKEDAHRRRTSGGGGEKEGGYPRPPGGTLDSVFLSLLGPSLNDDRVVMSVVCRNPDGSPYIPPGSLLLRDRVFHKYEKGLWTGGNRFAVLEDADDGEKDGWIRILPPRPASWLSVFQDIELAPTGSACIPALAEMEAIQLQGIIADEEGSFFLSFLPSKSLHYRVKSKVPDLKAEALPKLRYPAMGREYCSLSRPYPEVERLARTIAESSASFLEACSNVSSYLKLNYKYANVMTAFGEADGGSDPVEEFLFEKRAGNCMHFSSAMIIMLRTLGIPCRLACGFMPDPPEKDTGDYLVRMRDAHAWVEVLTEKYGWLAYDPTTTHFPDPAQSDTSPFTAFWERYGPGAWFRYLAGFGGAEQKSIFHSILRFFLAGGWVLAAGTIALFFFLRRRKQPEREGSKKRVPLPGARGFYQQFLHILRKRGIRRKASQTPWEFAKKAGATLPHKAVSRITELHCEVRYGGKKLDRQKKKMIREELNLIKEWEGGD